MKEETKKQIEKLKIGWEDNKDKFIFGAKCLAVGLGIGFIKGMISESKYSFDRISDLSERLINVSNNKFKDIINSIPDSDLLNELRERGYNDYEVMDDGKMRGLIDIAENILEDI